MGIPSYFRTLLKSHPHTIRQTLPIQVKSLCFDFNCLVYRCLHAPQLRPFPGWTDPEDADRWEGELLDTVVHTVKEVWAAAGSPAHVYLAVDGVVPMAKIRQQRVRRFKSAWLSQGGWDKNAITPGTLFMDKLTTALQALVKKQGSKWVLSSVNEPGEGEHKLLAYLRGSALSSHPMLIYGLDADLILLSMLLSQQTSQPVWLMRERQEFESKGSVSVTEYSFLDIEAVKEKIHVTDWMSCLNYVTLMSLMGNDFLPHSLTHKLSNDGHSKVIQELLSMKETGAWLVTPTLNLSVLQGIASRWATEETERMYQMIEHKQKQGRRGLLPGMDESEGLPLVWNVEKDFLNGRKLVDDWRARYWSFMHERVNREQVCGEYVKGIQWIVAYYLGEPVDKEWMYPYWIPPLWSDLARMSSMPRMELGGTLPPSPQEQLAMVLPLASWGLVREPYRRLPLLCPQAWPTNFSFFSLGRRWLWECEARVPVLTAGRIRELLMENK